MDGVNFKQKLKEIENRIRSMSLIHEKLYKSDSISKLNVEEYITELTEHIIQSQESAKRVKLQLSVDKTEYGIDSLIPLGLIINECISNSLQHGFIKNEGNEISIELRQNSEQTIIKIYDNGTGTSKSINELKAESLGMELISDLTEQLDGVVNLDTKDGFKYDFIFPSLK
jgi:two-component sensor histidine kinase